MNPLYFSELLKVKSSSEVCEKHQQLKMQYEEQEPFCAACVRESIRNENAQQVARAVNFEQDRKRKYLRINSLLEDQTLANARFETFRTNTQTEQTVKQQAQEIAARYLNGEVFNTILTGSAGTGKSHLAMAILQEVNEKAQEPQEVAFASTSEILRKIRGSYDDKEKQNSEERVLERFAHPQLLVLDDLGTETGGIGTTKKASDFTQNILYSLSNRRQDRSTIITTNLTGEQISGMYDQKLISRLTRRSQGNILNLKDLTDKRKQNLGF